MHFIGQLSDLPLPGSGQQLRTRRKALAQIVLCKGCCCGRTDQGLPAVPLDWLKPIWKSEKLNKVVQLTVSGCLGPCDLPNVCCVVTPTEQAWYGRLTTQEDYAVLLRWARECRDTGQVVPLPVELLHLRFERWPGTDDKSGLAPIEQEPADIVLLSAADTDLLAWSAAMSRLPADFPSVRALNLDRLRDRAVFDAYLDDVLQDSRVIVLRLLGGLAYWREQLEAVHLLARAHSIALLCLSGDSQPDPDLAKLNTIPLEVADRAWRYCIAGGIANAAAMLQHLSDAVLATSYGAPLPEPLPEVGIYHPRADRVLDLAGWRERFAEADRPTAAIAFYRPHWVTGNLAPIDTMVAALESRGMNVLPVFGPNLGAILGSGLVRPDSMDLLITTTSFSTVQLARSASEGSSQTPNPRLRGGLSDLDVPVLQAIFCSSSENVWAANIAGLTPRDVAMNVALPEFDGRIITTAVSFKNTQAHDPALQTEIVRYQPRQDRIDHVAELAANWIKLRRLPNSQKNIAIILANYPSKNARVGNAVGLDTPASLHALLVALRSAGYDTGPELPADGQSLIESLIAASTQDAEFGTLDAVTAAPGAVALGRYRDWLARLPADAHGRLVDRWGLPEASPQFHAAGFPVAGLRFGNVFIGIQPARGYDQDPSLVYHSPDLPPPPFYLAFYRWLAEEFGAHAVIHLGKHGNLEWLPGKSAALSESCFPEAMLGPLPNVYPYIINNPGEGTQAKRRTAAVIVDHMIPPMTRADTHGELRQLEHLLDEYYAIQSLDPGKTPLILERIRELVQTANLYRDLECEQPPDVDELPAMLNRIDGYLCEIKESQIRDGLHILGRLPEGESLIDLLASLVHLDNGSVPGLPRAIADGFCLDYRSLTADLAAPAPATHANYPAFLGARTCGDVVERLGQLARQLIQQSLSRSTGAAMFWFTRHCELPPSTLFIQIDRALRFLLETVWPRLQACPDEIANILKAMEGRFVPSGPAGAPTRGTADILPTGRNFYSLDIRAVPTPTAWQVGSAAAASLLERHRERTGRYPESVAYVIWGTSNMRTGGDDIACVLALLGVRPCWDAANRRVVGIEAIPLTELGRPRVDVTIRISGLFRDAFPNLVKLLNDAVELVARLEESLDDNFLRASIARDTARLLHATPGEPKPTCTVEEASRIASLRVFGSKPGAYGAGLLPLIDGRNWRDGNDLADVYITWSSYAYTGTDGDGQAELRAFQLRLEHTEVVAQNQDNREHDIFDSDDYFQFHGGLIAAVRAVKGTAPAAYFGDTSVPDQVRTRTLREEACRVFRTRVVNPRWLAGVMRHGYKGAVEMAATVDYLFGYDATAEVIDDWMYERLVQSYLFEEPVRDFLRRVNPWAERAMIERMLEAAARGLWKHPDPATLARLQQQHGDSEAWLEGRVEKK